MRRLTTLLTLSLAVAGCAQTYWTKPGFNPADWNRDRYECERDMRQSGYYGTGLVGAINAQSFFEECLSARGYYKVRESRTTAPAYNVPTTPPSDFVSPKKARIEALKTLRDSGNITDEQFEDERAKIIMEP